MAKKERKRNETQRLTRDRVFIDLGGGKNTSEWPPVDQSQPQRELSGGVPE